jgi:hypothetical protein
VHLYFQSTKVSSNDAAKSTRSAARGLPVPSLASSMQTNHEPEAEPQKIARTHQKREWGKIIREQAEAVPLRSVVANVSYAEEKDFQESHADDKRFHKSHPVRRMRSPDRHNQRKRSRVEDERSTKVFILFKSLAKLSTIHRIMVLFYFSILHMHTLFSISFIKILVNMLDTFFCVAFII